MKYTGCPTAMLDRGEVPQNIENSAIYNKQLHSQILFNSTNFNIFLKFQINFYFLN